MASCDAGALSRLDEDTEVVKAAGDKQRFTNVRHGKVAHKMFDPNCDVRISVGNEIVKAHKDVLSAASDYFCAMFSHDMIEKEKSAIEISGMTPKGFRIVLEYFYHGHVVLDSDNVEDCLEAARFLQVDWLVKACGHFLLRHINVESWSYAFELVDRYALYDIRKDLFVFFGQNFVALDESSDLVNLPLGWFLDLLSGEHYVDAVEELVLQAIINWVNHDFEARKSDLSKLVQTIRFNLMDQEQLGNIPEAILGMDNVLQKVEAAKALWDNVYAQCVVDQNELLPRGAAPTLVALATHDVDTIQYMRPPCDDHTYVHKEKLGCEVINVIVDLAAVATLGNFLFVAGGYESGSYNMTNRVHRYDPRFSEWLPVASLNIRRANFALFAHGAQLLAVGGSTQGGTAEAAAVDDANPEPGLNEQLSDSCELYDPVLNQWSSLPSLHFGCSGMAGCTLNGVAYISGGMTDNPADDVPASYVCSLRLSDDMWTPHSPMLHRRQGHSMTAFDGKLYVFGGDTAGVLGDAFLGKIPCLQNECYDPVTDQWTAIMPTPASVGTLHKGVAVLDDVVYILGGQYSSRYLHEFHPRSNEWKEGPFCGNSLNRLVQVDMAIPCHLPSDLSPTHGHEDHEDVPEDEQAAGGVAG